MQKYSFASSYSLGGLPEYENGKADVTHLLPKNWKASSKDFNQR